MSHYSSIEPTVVDEELLEKAVKETEEAENNRKSNLSDIPTEVLKLGSLDPDEVSYLRLDYKSE